MEVYNAARLQIVGTSEDLESIGPGGETGRRKGLKILFPQGSVGSIPTPGTI
jgi:hypothetical protein